jgi:hypothetical protein
MKTLQQMEPFQSSFANKILATSEENSRNFSPEFLKEFQIEMVSLKELYLDQLMRLPRFRKKKVSFEFGSLMTRSVILDPSITSVDVFVLTMRRGPILANGVADKICNFREIFMNFNLVFKSSPIEHKNCEWTFYVFERRKQPF